jgi:hypothetical protein
VVGGQYLFAVLRFSLSYRPKDSLKAVLRTRNVLDTSVRARPGSLY